MKIGLTSILFLFISNFYFGQVLLYQDILKGGVKCVSFSTGIGSGTGKVDLSAPVGSVIKKIFLITYSQQNSDKTLLLLNGNEVLLDSLILVSHVKHLSVNVNDVKVYFFDVTYFLKDENLNDISVDINTSCPDIINCGFWTASFVVLYEDLTMMKTGISLFIPNKDLVGTENYLLSGINPMENTNPIAFSIFMDRACNNTSDGSRVTINDQFLGIIGGEDSPNIGLCTGSQGNFFYQNKSITALTDDNIDLGFSGTDALGDISSIVNNLSTQIKVYLEHNNLLGVPEFRNDYILFPIAYSTPCDVFPITVSKDTSICINSPLQLSALGGVKYAWLPTTGLSCTDCPNPSVTTDSSRLYTVQIWNNDTCSVIRPIKVNVLPLPQFNGISSTPSLCGSNTGSLTAVAAPDTRLKISYGLDGASPQQVSTYTGNFNNLAGGAHTLRLIDGFGCITDTTVQIGINNPTDAQFTANPNTGAAPLFVDITNTSVSASNYSWFLNGVAQANPFTGFVADTSGTYEIKLYAWDTDPNCADSFQLIVLAFDSLLLEIPNVFTPNNDGINQVFGISATLPVSIKYSILNRWGNEVANGSSSWQIGMPIKGKVFYPLWNGIDATEGVYFYQLEITELNGGKISKQDGFVHLFR